MLTLAVGGSAVAAGADAGSASDVCRDLWQVVFAAKAKEISFWLFPTKPFVAQLPATLTAEAGNLKMEAKLRRVSDDYVAVEYTMTSEPLALQAALISVFLPIDDRRGFNGQVTD